MIPGPLCALQRAELPEHRVARGGPWCRRVEVLQQVLPSPRLTKSLRGSQFGCSPLSFVGGRRPRALAVGLALPTFGIGGGTHSPITLFFCGLDLVLGGACVTTLPPNSS